MTHQVLAYIPSPPQGIFQLGPLPLRMYAICIIAGVIVAIVWGEKRWQASGGQEGVVGDVALWALPFGLIGGRLYHVATDWHKYFGEGKNPLDALKIWEGGLGIWGAIALGAVAAAWALKRRSLPIGQFADAVAPGIIVAQAIGRLGNYFNQELYGRATDVAWGLQIFVRETPTGARGTTAGTSTGEVLTIVHPTFLYELLWNLAVAAFLVWAHKAWKLKNGQVFALYVAAYCLGRFWVELMRADPATLVAGLRINTITSTVLLVCALYVFVRLRQRPQNTVTPEQQPENGAAQDSDTDDSGARTGESKDTDSSPA